MKLHSKLQEDTDKARKEIAYVILKVKGYTSACMQILQINFRHIATNLNINNIPLFQNIKLLVSCDCDDDDDNELYHKKDKKKEDEVELESPKIEDEDCILIQDCDGNYKICHV